MFFSHWDGCLTFQFIQWQRFFLFVLMTHWKQNTKKHHCIHNHRSLENLLVLVFWLKNFFHTKRASHRVRDTLFRCLVMTKFLFCFSVLFFCLVLVCRNLGRLLGRKFGYNVWCCTFAIRLHKLYRRIIGHYLGKKITKQLYDVWLQTSW